MKVTLGTLKDKGEELASFLEPRVGTKPSISGGTMEMEDGSLKSGMKPRKVKTYIKRFLYMNGVRKKYRVFVTGNELLIQEIVVGEEEEEPEKKAEEKVEEAPAEEKAPEKEEPPEEPKPDEGEEKKEEAKEPEEKPAEPKPKKAPAKKPRAPRKKKADS